MKEGVAIVGVGKVGTSIAVALHNAGYKIVGLSSRKRNDSVLFSICSNFSTRPNEITPLADIVLITVTDDSIESVCRDIASNSGFKRGALVVQTSGALSSDVLLSAKGCNHLSIHPVKTFTSLDPVSLDGVFFSVEGDDEEKGKRMVEDIVGVPFVIKKEDKLLYHAALTFCSSHLVGILALSVSILKSIGLDGKLAFCMVRDTLDDTNRVGFKRSFTGPVTRMDIETIRKEMEALKDDSAIAKETYRTLTQLVAHMQRELGLMEQDKLESLKRSLEDTN